MCTSDRTTAHVIYSFYALLMACYAVNYLSVFTFPSTVIKNKG